MVLSDLVLVYGVPAVGKSIVAPSLADRLGLSRLGKDDVKEALWDGLEQPSSMTPLEWSRHLGGLAYELIWHLASALGPQLIVEAPLSQSSGGRILELHPPPVEVFLWARPEVIYERSRLRQSHQHPCHLPHGLPSLDEVNASLRLQRPLRLGGPLLEVDLSDGHDLQGMAEWLQAQLSTSATSR